MTLEDKFHNGTVTIQDIKPEIHSVGLAKSNGYVMESYAEIIETMKNLKFVWGSYKEAMQALGDVKGYAGRLAKTKEELEQYMQENFK